MTASSMVEIEKTNRPKNISHRKISQVTKTMTTNGQLQWCRQINKSSDTTIELLIKLQMICKILGLQ